MTQDASMIHVAIVSWDGQHDNARAVAAAVQGVAGAVSVAWSSEAEKIQEGAGDWLRLPQSAWFGPKFRALLGRVAPGQRMFLVQADAQCSDWVALVRRCAAVMEAQPDIGLWSPTIDVTPYPDNRVATGDSPRPGLIEVLQTDAIVLGLAPPLPQRLAELDYSINNLGWGIDWAAISIAGELGLIAVRDRSARVVHPPSRGYGDTAAEAQMWAFLSQLGEAGKQAYFAKDGVLRRRQAAQAREDHLLSGWLAEQHARAGLQGADLPAEVAGLCLAGGRLCVAAKAVSVSIAGHRLGLTRSKGVPPCTALPLAPAVGSGAGARSGDRRVATGRSAGAVADPGRRGAAPCEVPLVTQVKVSRGLGAVQLALGLAAHRARADLMVHWHDSEDRDRGERIYIPFEPDHVGLRVHGDYQGVRLTIPDIGSDRVLSLALCFWGQPDEGAEGAPVLLVSHPVLLAGRAADDGISPVVMTGPQAVSTDREVPAEVQWEADLTALPDGLRGPLVLHLGDRDLPLLAPATDGGAALRQTATGSRHSHAYRCRWLWC